MIKMVFKRQKEKKDFQCATKREKENFKRFKFKRIDKDRRLKREKRICFDRNED